MFVENSNIQIQATIAALIHDPHCSLRPSPCICYLYRGLAARTNRSTKGSPSILLTPSERLVSVPSRTISADSIQVPSVLLGVIIMIRCTNIRGLFPTASTFTIALAIVGRQTVVVGRPTIAPLTAAYVSCTSLAAGLLATYLSTCYICR